MSSKPRVLVCCGTYIPYSPSGVLRNVANTVDRLGSTIEFAIVTRYLDSYTEHGIQPNETRSVGKARVHYALPARLGWTTMGETLKLFDYDVLWLNSCFTNLTVKALLHRQLGRGVKKPVVLAPKGELLSHALQHKALKKKLYLRSADLAGLYDGVIWMAASRTEKENIKSIFGSTAEVRVVQDIPDRDLLTDRTLCDKKSGTLSVIFLSRISPVKNLDQALRALQGVRDVHIDFDIYGPVQDDEYWETCRSLMRKLPENIEANYGGVLKYEEVFETLKSHDLLFHPSQGESYGHVILEALAASCPVLIGDGTPWSDSLSRKAGWVVPCDDQSAYRAVLREAAEMDGAEFYEYCESAHELARDHILHSDAVQKMQNLFESIATQ